MGATIEDRHLAPTREEFLQACKAIHDEVMGSVNARLKSLAVPPPAAQPADLKRWVQDEVGRLLPSVVEAVAEKFASVLAAVPAVSVTNRPMEKTFTYDGMGRPATVVEREIPEPVGGDRP